MNHNSKSRRYKKNAKRTVYTSKRNRRAKKSLLIEFGNDVDSKEIIAAIKQHCRAQSNIDLTGMAKTRGTYIIKVFSTGEKARINLEREQNSEKYHRVLGALYNRETTDIENLLEVLKEKH